ncbi:MAG: hypothetical protein V4671_19350 [Armatimonadota bacterium]
MTGLLTAPDLLTVPQYAERVGVSTCTVYARISAGKIAAYKISGIVRSIRIPAPDGTESAIAADVPEAVGEYADICPVCGRKVVHPTWKGRNRKHCSYKCRNAYRSMRRAARNHTKRERAAEAMAAAAATRERRRLEATR